MGGEKFQPWLAACREEFVPDLITVAYGTNDWSKREKEEFEENCRGFFVNLVKNYPDTPILVITPLWRRIWQNEKPCGPYRSVDAFLKKEAGQYKNVTVMDGFGIMPRRLDYFGDYTVHPSDVGFDRYFEEIRRFLEERALSF